MLPVHECAIFIFFSGPESHGASSETKSPLSGYCSLGLFHPLLWGEASSRFAKLCS